MNRNTSNSMTRCGQVDVERSSIAKHKKMKRLEDQYEELKQQFDELLNPKPIIAATSKKRTREAYEGELVNWKPRKRNPPPEPRCGKRPSAVIYISWDNGAPVPVRCLFDTGAT